MGQLQGRTHSSTVVVTTQDDGLDLQPCGVRTQAARDHASASTKQLWLCQQVALIPLLLLLLRLLC
jgi:hypothetical protein